MAEEHLESEADFSSASLAHIGSTVQPTYRTPIGNVVVPVNSQTRRIYDEILYTHRCFRIESTAPPVHSHGMAQVDSVWEADSARRLGNIDSFGGPIYGDGAVLTRYETAEPVEPSSSTQIGIKKTSPGSDRLLDLDYTGLLCSAFKAAAATHSAPENCVAKCDESCDRYREDLESIAILVKTKLDESVQSKVEAEKLRDDSGVLIKVRSELRLLEKCLERHKTRRHSCGGTKGVYCSLHKWHLMRNALLQLIGYTREVEERLCAREYR